MRAFIDSLKGDFAVIHIEEVPTELIVPIRLLPEGSRDGSWLNMYFELDPEGAMQQEKKIIGFLEQLKKKDKANDR